MNNVNKLSNDIVLIKNEDFSDLTYRRIGFALMCLSSIVSLTIMFAVANRIIHLLS